MKHSTAPTADPGSFRDPAGHIFRHQGKLYRQINQYGKDDYEHFMASGLYAALLERKLIVGHSEVMTLKGLPTDPNRYKVIQPEEVPFISYPYEWVFDQLKAAALATLEIMQVALKHGMILKDASAYNVQFMGDRPIFIDTLSFAVYKEGDQWEGYKQFCEHFLAPLALAHHSSMGILKSQTAFLDGMPLQTACDLLPGHSKLKSGLLAHLHLHNSSQRRHQQGGQAVAEKAKARKLTPLAMQGLLSSLERTVKKLRPPISKTEWGDYYTFTNYSDEAFKAKRKLVKSLAKLVPNPKIVWDVGANNGEFSEIGAELGAYTVAFDIDTIAVSRNYHTARDSDIKRLMLPLVQDLTNPSPAIGWAHAERASLIQRGPADIVMALAIIHHLCIGNNLPFDKVAEFLRQIGKHVIIEFVPKGDSKVDHLLASRKDIFTTYDAKHFEAAMDRHFKLVEKKPVKGSKRSVYLYKAK